MYLSFASRLVADLRTEEKREVSPRPEGLKPTVKNQPHFLSHPHSEAFGGLRTLIMVRRISLLLLHLCWPTGTRTARFCGPYATGGKFDRLGVSRLFHASPYTIYITPKATRTSPRSDCFCSPYQPNGGRRAHPYLFVRSLASPSPADNPRHDSSHLAALNALISVLVTHFSACKNYFGAQKATSSSPATRPSSILAPHTQYDRRRQHCAC